VFKTFEGAMEDYIKSLESGTIQNTTYGFSEYLFDFLIMQFGLRAIAVRNLAAIKRKICECNQKSYFFSKIIS
jgi:hypothetical protein